MMKVTKNLCRAALSIAAAITLFSGAHSVAKAANDEVVIDFSQGQEYVITAQDFYGINSMDEMKNASANMKTFLFGTIFVSLHSADMSTNNKPLSAVLNQNPFQALYLDGATMSEVDPSDPDALKKMQFKLYAGESTGTYELTVTKETNFSKSYSEEDGRNYIRDSNGDYTDGMTLLRAVETLYGIKATDANGNRYVKIRFDFKNPKSSIVSVDEKGTAQTVIPDKAFEENGYSYEVTKEGEEVAFKGVTDKTRRSVNIPDVVVHQNITYKVTSVADKALFKNTKVKSVTIGQNVTTIGKSAFAKCKKLKSFKINSAVLTSIGKKALAKTSDNLVIKVPKAQYKKYKKMLKKAISAPAKIKKIK